MFEAKSNNTQGRALRPDHNTYNNAPTPYPPYTAKFHGTELFQPTADVTTVINGAPVVLNRAGDKWLHVTDVDGTPASGWVAIIHMGVTYCSLVDLGEPVPPSVQVTGATVHFDDGSNVELVVKP